MSQQLSVKGFKWVKNLSKFNGDFNKKTMTKVVLRDNFLK